jgi:hypothetical protein
MKWIGKRISFVEDKHRTTIVIYPEDKTWIKALMGAWVAMWLVIGAATVGSFFMFNLPQQQQLILIVFIVFWSYYAIKVIRSFAWLMWGRELIKIDEIAVHYKKSTRGYGKSIPYYLENIKKIAISIPEERSIQHAWEISPWIRGGERIEFEYLQKTIRIGRKIEEKEAKLLFNLLTKKIEERLKNN